MNKVINKNISPECIELTDTNFQRGKFKVLIKEWRKDKNGNYVEHRITLNCVLEDMYCLNYLMRDFNRRFREFSKNLIKKTTFADDE